jgi:hypothetical protein
MERWERYQNNTSLWVRSCRPGGTGFGIMVDCCLRICQDPGLRTWVHREWNWRRLALIDVDCELRWSVRGLGD